MKTLCIVLALSLAVVLGALVAGAALLFRGGISARVEPTNVEAGMARRLLRLGIPDSSRQLRNPVAPSKDVLAAGRAHFADHCAICHGNDGAGRTEMGRNLYPRAPDLRLPQTQELTDGELFYIIENGVRLTGMPEFKHSLNDTQIWQVSLLLANANKISDAVKEKLKPPPAPEASGAPAVSAPPPTGIPAKPGRVPISPHASPTTH